MSKEVQEGVCAQLRHSSSQEKRRLISRYFLFASSPLARYRRYCVFVRAISVQVTHIHRHGAGPSAILFFCCFF